MELKLKYMRKIDLDCGTVEYRDLVDPGGVIYTQVHIGCNQCQSPNQLHVPLGRAGWPADPVCSGRQAPGRVPEVPVCSGAEKPLEYILPKG